MINTDFTTWSAIATVSSAFLLATAYLLTSLVNLRSERAEKEQIAIGLAVATQAAAGEEVDSLAVHRIRSTSPTVKQAIFHRLAAVISGQNAENIRQLAEQIGVTDDMHRAARSRLWWRRLEAVRFFSTLGGERELLTSLMNDRDSWVRAEATGWAGMYDDPQIIERLVGVLEKEDRFCESIARDSIIRSGRLAASPVAAHLKTEMPERQLISFLTVGRFLKDPEPGAAALKLSRHQSARVRAAVASVLGSAVTGDSSKTLIAMLGDESCAVRIAACKALGNIGHWPASSNVAELLSHDDWEVKVAATEALVAMGNPGTIMLHNAIDSDGASSDLAQQALDEYRVFTGSKAA